MADSYLSIKHCETVIRGDGSKHGYMFDKNGKRYLRQLIIKDGTIWRYDRFGNYHHEDGPAIERSDGSKEWWIDGGRHRLDGPAVIYRDGSGTYYIKNKQLSVTAFNIKVKELQDAKPI